MFNKIYNDLFNKNSQAHIKPVEQIEQSKQSKQSEQIEQSKQSKQSKQSEQTEQIKQTEQIEQVEQINKKANLDEINNKLLDNLINSCINLYDPNKNNNLEIESKLYLEYPREYVCAKEYIKYKQILLDKMLEKKNIFADMKINILTNKKKYKYIEYYCLYVSINTTIYISKTDNLFKFMNNNQNILYCLEYINVNQISIETILEKYNLLYSCKIIIC